MQTILLESEQAKALALLMFMRDGLTAREIGMTLSLPQATTDIVLADLMKQGLVTSSTGLFSRCKTYRLSGDGTRMLDAAVKRTEAIIPDTEKKFA